MRSSTLFLAAIVLAAVPVTASAMSRDSVRMLSGARASASDPDERIERMAAAATPADNSQGKPRKSVRSVLKDDHYLSNAFAWLDNK